MMKWIFLGVVFFLWFFAVPLFNLMARRDYNNLQGGLQRAKQLEQQGYTYRNN